MSRPIRIEYPGAFYHITARGNGRQNIFLDEIDFKIFKDIFREVMRRYNWRCYAYCFMSNHYHVLIETIDGRLSLGMRQLNGVYTQKFNRKHNRVGHIFQGRFKGILVDKESYLLELCRYISLNPLRAKMVDKVADWRWSSYHEMVGKSEKKPLVEVSWVLEQFANDPIQAIKAYQQFIKEGVNEGSVWRDGVRGSILGNKQFIDRVKKQFNIPISEKEISRKDRFVGRKDLKDFIFLEEGKVKRNQGIYQAYYEHGYTFAEIAKYLGMHYSTVSRICRSVYMERSEE